MNENDEMKGRDDEGETRANVPSWWAEREGKWIEGEKLKWCNGAKRSGSHAAALRPSDREKSGGNNEGRVRRPRPHSARQNRQLNFGSTE